MPVPKSYSTLVGVAVLALAFAALYLIPKFTRQTTFTIPIQNTKPAVAGSFPLDHEFGLVEVSAGRAISSKRKVKLKDLLVGPESSLIINFWATWCPPCIEELPSLEYLNRQLRERKDKEKPMVVAISVDAALADIATLYKTLDFDATFTLLHDQGGDFATAVGTTKFPETYWVNAQGKALFKWLGPQDWLSASILNTLKRG